MPARRHSCGAATLPGLAPRCRAFLLIRGLWLVVLELTVMRFAWTFNFDVINYNLAGVLWMIGWSMVALAGLVWLPFSAIAALGLAIIFGHNLVDPYRARPRALDGGDPMRWVCQFLYFGGSVQHRRLGAAHRDPVFAAAVDRRDGGRLCVRQRPGAAGRARRSRVCLAIGAGAIALFIVLRTFNVYGDPRHWSPSSRCRS